MEIFRAKEHLRYELADVMLLALRKEAGIALTSQEWERLRDKLAEALRGEVTL